ncbi:TPA: hypothetical protein ACXE9F_004709 [Pluralibacter gergoviae]
MKIVVWALLFIPVFCSSKSMDEFFKDNPDLKSNPFTRSAIISQAGVATINDIMLQKQPGEMSGQVMKRLLKEDGYSYALVAIRQLAEQCRQGVAESASNLRKNDCDIIVEHSARN